jgi:uncharacterized membrane protein
MPRTGEGRVVSTARLETFADGVFAIAATLLIIDVGLPANLHDSLGQELLQIWPQYLAYAISFATIGIICVNHHAVLVQVGRVDRSFLFLNLGLLLSVAFIPFPTRVLAEFVRTQDDGRAAALLYGVTMMVMSVTFLSVWLYASVGRRLTVPDADSQAISGITRSFLPGLPMYTVATLIALVSPKASAALFGLLALFYMVSSSFFGRREDRRFDSG